MLVQTLAELGLWVELPDDTTCTISKSRSGKTEMFWYEDADDNEKPGKFHYYQADNFEAACTLARGFGFTHVRVRVPPLGEIVKPV